MKKRFFLFLLSLLLCSTAAAFAEGSGNVDTGGGGMGTGGGGSGWNSNEYGVRISVILKEHAETVACFDWSSCDESNVQRAFGKTNKIRYKCGRELTPAIERYEFKIPSTPLPVVVSSRNGVSNAAAIKRYFTTEGVLMEISADSGVAYDDLIGGDYAILLEPIAYYKFKGVKYATTATEAALLDVATSRQLYYAMWSLTHQNLPLAMFLERDEEIALSFGLHRWTGAKTGKQNNADIVTYLGMGLVTFEDRPEEPPAPSEYDYVFRTDTDVIVSFPIYSSRDITPANEAYVTLNVGDHNINRQFICPAGGTQLIWVQWHTPSEPQEMTLTASGAGSPVTLRVNIVKLEENQPPDPTFYDKGDGWTLDPLPDYGKCTYTTWGEWSAEWIQEHGWHGKGEKAWKCKGYCARHGYWHFYYTEYHASLNTSFAIKPDTRCQTAYESRYGRGTVMPSGYGIEADVGCTVVMGSGVGNYDVTPCQYVIATFPEFGYETFDRFLQESHGRWHFKENLYSYYRNPIHFTPLWYPDDTYYPVSFVAFDAWTPGGHLYATGTDRIYIDRSCLDDWYIHIVE